MSQQPRFDEALAAALAWVQAHRTSLDGAWLLRDIFGRIRVVTSAPFAIAARSVDERHALEIEYATLAGSLHEVLGAFSPGPHAVFADPALFEGEEERDAELLFLPGEVKLVDRLVSEQGWRRPPVASPDPGRAPRITFFGLKGGVGRSTALVALARRLAELGRRVLVVDLDLESPGVTSMLLEEHELPPFGTVDWFVEDAVGQGDLALARDMALPSRLGAALQGDVLVAPAFGSASLPALEPSSDAAQTLRDGAFVSKLGRAYASPGGTDFAERIEAMLVRLEEAHSPDCILLDSRAGLHDISAAAVPRLGSTVLLFAGATIQTSMGYRLLFSAWRRDQHVLARFRDRLRVVAAQVPETGRAAYTGRVRDAFYDLFANFVYDRVYNASDEAATPDPFTFDVRDPDAPHAPLPVYWRRELVEWEPAAPLENLTPEQLSAAFGPFLDGVLKLPYVADLLLKGPKAGR